MDIVDWIERHQLLGDAIRTGLLLALLFLARWFVLHRLRQAEGLSNDLRRRWVAQVRLVALLLLLLGLAVIWGTELKTFALSVVAIAAAIVIATKELIMCVSGTVLKASGRSFQIGDRIEVNNIRGDVVDQTLLATTILEVGPGVSIHQRTGRIVVIPNSLMLTAPVFNETFLDDYVLHVFAVPVSEADDWRGAERSLLEASRAECAEYLEAAQAHIERLVRSHALEPMSVAPRVTLRVDEPGKITMLVRVPAPARLKGRVEQAILRRYLEWREQVRAETPTERGKAPSDESAI